MLAKYFAGAHEFSPTRVLFTKVFTGVAHRRRVPLLLLLLLLLPATRNVEPGVAENLRRIGPKTFRTDCAHVSKHSAALHCAVPLELSQPVQKTRTTAEAELPWFQDTPN